MHRSELKKVAEGLKAARPAKYHERKTIDSTYVTDRCEQWETTVGAVANALELKDKPRSNFLAAAGFHAEDQT